MRLRFLTVLVLVGLAAGCAQRRDPVLEAAENFRDASYESVERDDEQKRRLNSLTLGMDQKEVLEQAGPPDSRTASQTFDSRSREIWIYKGTLGRRLGRLVLEDGSLSSVSVP